jgi:hypothetical protein
MVLHGLISGATGTGKSRAIQVLAEGLSDSGVNVILADLKGDMGGFVKANASPESAKRAKSLGIEYSPKAFEANFYSVGGSYIPLRIRLQDVDPSLVARVLKLNETQESNLQSAFIFAKRRGLGLNDMQDMQAVLLHLLDNPEESPGVTKATINVILRNINVFISDGLDEMFGEPALDVQDLLSSRRLNVVDLSNWRRNSELPSVIMGFLLYRIFQSLPDVGSKGRPGAVIFIDEAHYLFQGANESLVSLFITILKQVRSKGIGVILSTQNPQDIPERVLEQLGCKIQFALRAFTQQELDQIRGLTRSFPATSGVDLVEEIKNLAIGETLVSPLGDDGRPQGPFKTAIAPPRTTMDVVAQKDVAATLDASLMQRYSQKVQTSRMDFSGGGLEGIRVTYDVHEHQNIKELKSLRRRQQMQVSKHWSRLKWIGMFVIAALFLMAFLALVLVLLLR